MMPFAVSSGMRAKAPGPTLRTSTTPLAAVFGRVSSITVIAMPFMVASTPSSAKAGSKHSMLKSCAIDFPAECECAYILAAEVGLDRAFRYQCKATHCHRRHQSIAGEIPVVLVRPEMLAAQRVLGIAKDRQREEQPLVHVGEERLKIRQMLEHVPQRCSIERNQMRIDEQRALLEPGDAGRIDIVAVGCAPPRPPQFDERTRADTDIDQGSAIVLLDEIKPRLH